MSLDDLDLKILWQLDSDARLSLAELARRTKSSRQLVNYRLKKLEDERVITGFISSVDIHRLGYLTYRLYLKFQPLHPEGSAKIFEHLQKHKNTLWVVSSKGAWDAEVVFVCRNFIHFNNTLKDFLAKYEPFLSRYNVSMSPVSYHFRRDYLINASRKDFSPTYYGFEPRYERRDAVDIAILAAVSKNCRITYEELADAANVTPQTARSRLELLHNDKLIPSYRILLDLEKLGRRYIKLLIKLKGLTKPVETKLYNFCAKRNFLIYLTEVLGDWQVELETEISDERQLAQLSADLGESFSKNVIECEMLEITKELKMDYFPMGTADMAEA